LSVDSAPSGTSTGRRHRRYWFGDGKAHIEVRAARRHGSERFARELEVALARMNGVHWAQVNAVVGRVVVAFDGEAVDSSAILETIEGVEEAHEVHDDRFGFDRPDFPGDIEPVHRAIVGLVADAVGIAAGVAGSMFDLPSLPEEAAALVSVAESQPRIRRLVEFALGPSTADIGLAVANAVLQGLGRGTLGLVVDLAHRGGLLDEAIARRSSWGRLEHELANDPSRVGCRPISRPGRPVPLPSGPVERYADWTGATGLAGAAGAFAFTTNPRKAAAMLLASVPKAGRLGREAFSARVGRVLASHDELVLDPAALRRLDRTDTVVIDAAVLLTGKKEPTRAVFASDVNPSEAEGRLHALFDGADASARHSRGGWTVGRLSDLSAPPTELRRLRRRLGHVASHGLMFEGRLAAVFAIGDEVAPGWQVLVRAARRARHMVVIAGDDLDLVERFGADMLVEAGDSLCGSVRMLQGDGCGVLLVAGPSHDALEAADCGIGLVVEGVVPWGADVIAKDLGTAVFLVEASIVARSVSQQSANLAVAGTAGGVLLAAALEPARASSSATISVNIAALAAIANGWRAGIGLARMPRHRIGAGPPWHMLEVDDVLALLGTSRGGLASSSVAGRLAPVARLAGDPARFAAAVGAELANPLTEVLAAGAALSAAVGSSADAVIVGAVSTLNALIGGAIRYQAENAVRSLDRASQQQVLVLRAGQPSLIGSDALVRGDVIALATGDAVPADCRVIEANNLEVDESSLTGESLPVAKSEAPSMSTLISERSSVLYAETSVVAGDALGVVVAVGEDTEATAGDVTLGAKVAGGVEERLRKLTMVSVPLAVLGGACVAGLGALRGQALSETLGSAVNLAVAAIPEGLPIVATMAQVAAARRLSAKGVLVRNPHALEALARVDVLCTDKTGTLTGGQIKLTSVCDGRRSSPIMRLANRDRSILAAALRATPPLVGDAVLEMTDRAVVEAAEGCGVEKALGAPGWALDLELPFEPSRGFHATVGTSALGQLIDVKGAPEVVLARCERWRDGSHDRPLDDKAHGLLTRKIERLASTGRRLLAVAEGQTTTTLLSGPDISGLTFLGLLAFSDPVRPSASAAVDGMRRAGIEVVVVTGDHASTAENVASKLGLMDGRRVLTGTQLGKLSDNQLDEVLAEVSVFARVVPADKVRIVEAYQRAGRAVAMTGDGANDAPAIRLADVGLALGQRSTSAARGAADIVITDDRIETLLDIVTEGRGMWGSVRDAVAILLGGNAGEVVFTVATSAIMGRPALSTRQLLLTNLMTDVVPALAIAIRPPRGRSAAQLLAEGPDRSLAGPMYGAIAQRAAATAAGAGAAWWAARLTGRRRRADTVGLVALVGSQLARPNHCHRWGRPRRARSRPGVSGGTRGHRGDPRRQRVLRLHAARPDGLGHCRHFLVGGDNGGRAGAAICRRTEGSERQLDSPQFPTNEVTLMPTTARSTTTASESEPTSKSEPPRTISLFGLPVPSPGTALYYGGIAALVAAELIDWPVALAVAVGHELLVRRQKPAA
jgi:cation-transporting ATPase I